MTLKELYLRVMAAIDSMPASVKADVDSAFMEHVNATPETAFRDPAPVVDAPLADPVPAPATPLADPTGDES